MENPVNWAILCPGPSLSRETSWQYDHGGLIAVNGAIIIAHADYWSFLDPELFSNCYRSAMRYSAHTTLWTHSNTDQLGTTVLNPQTGDIIWDTPAREAYRNWIKRLFFSNLPDEMPFAKEIIWNEYAFFAAIALAILRGAKFIRIYGADMSGTGYFLPGLENAKTNHKEKRWAYERTQFSRIVCACGEHGIIVQRVSNGSRN